MRQTRAALRQRSEAGKAAIAALRERLGEEGFRAHMQELGRKGGRPTYREAIEKAKAKEAVAMPLGRGRKKEVSNRVAVPTLPSGSDTSAVTSVTSIKQSARTR